MVTILYLVQAPQGWIWRIYRQGSAEYFSNFEFREFVPFWLLNKSCILKCFILSKVFFNSPGASVIMGLHYYHMMLEFRQMNSVFDSIFRVLLFGKYFFGFFSGKVFFGSFRNIQLH